jgi:hypothetical protein
VSTSTLGGPPAPTRDLAAARARAHGRRYRRRFQPVKLQAGWTVLRVAPRAEPEERPKFGPQTARQLRREITRRAA